VVAYKSEKLEKKWVYYSGTSAIYTGSALTYDRDAGSSGGTVNERVWEVERPTGSGTSVLQNFAGIVPQEYNGRTGPQWIQIIEPGPGFRVVRVRTDQDCTARVTLLGIVGDTTVAGAGISTQPVIARALQTVNRSGTVGTVLAELYPRGPRMEAMTTEAVTTGITGGTTGGTSGLTAYAAGGTIGIDKNLRLVAEETSHNISAIAKIITALKTAGIMDID